MRLNHRYAISSKLYTYEMNFQIGGQKKYGLITRKPPATSTSLLKKSVLNTVDDEEEQLPDIRKVNQELARQRVLESDQILAQTDTAILENPDVYDYDSYVDTKKDQDLQMQASRLLSSRDNRVIR